MCILCVYYYIYNYVVLLSRLERSHLPLYSFLLLRGMTYHYVCSVSIRSFPLLQAASTHDEVLSVTSTGSPHRRFQELACL